jgi:hypothetical protein
MPNRPSKNLLRVLNLANNIHVGLYRMSRGKFAGNIANLPILLITTVGRKSGKPHTNAVVFLTGAKLSGIGLVWRAGLAPGMVS